MDNITLYGVPHSLYTGKTRAYLRKQGIDFVERAPDAHFVGKIVPQLGRAILPVIELPDGTVLQDSVTILDHFEREGVPMSAIPPSPRQRVLAHVAELFAVVSLTRHAMHYRWNFPEQQDRFLRHAFASGTGGRDPVALMARMQSYLPMLGVTAETIPAIEASYSLLLAHLDAHFTKLPYLFGGLPSLGDYGLLGPLFAHLGRDPVPADLMKRTAPSVWRWVERMNAPEPDYPEFPKIDPAYLPDDAIPDTLVPLYRHMADELFPELTDMLRVVGDHVARADPAEGEPVTDKPQQRIIGTVATRFRGIPCELGVQPYTLFLWQRITDAFLALDKASRETVRSWFAEAGLGALLDAHRPIRVDRKDHLEVWGERARD